MLDQMQQWRGVARAPWAARARGANQAQPRSARRSVRRVGLRLASLGAIAVLCALSGTAVFDGKVDPLKGPQPVTRLSPGQGLAPWLVE